MKEKITVSATGDALFVADIPEEYAKDMEIVSGYIKNTDVRISNLETNVSKFGEFPNAYSGGTWLNTEPEVFDDLVKYGFNYYGTANNHCMDYSYHGMLSTIDELDKRGLAHSGTGRCLEEASAPAIIETKGQKVAIFAVSAEFNPASKAGYKTNTLEGRPGVNYIGHENLFPITPEMVEKLKEVDKVAKVNARRENSIRTGYSLPDPEGIYNFGGVKFTYDGSEKRSVCNKKDLERITNDIKKAKEQYDYVLILIHCHDVRVADSEEVPHYLEELSRACIDAGASAMIGGGTHQLRPLEIYKGCPIFYSLGDFIYQGMRVPLLPADFMIQYGCDINATAWEGLMTRSKGGKIGLQAQRSSFLTVIPRMEFENGKMVALEMMPIVAGFEREGKMNGLPYHAKGKESKEIFDILDRLSTPYGTKLSFKDDMIRLEF
ncbi:MAG: CapA family protein [Clostridia bacterium]|nr:CapA family protein [Clostridia bacterium]